MKKIAKAINASPDLYCLTPVTAEDVERAVESLEQDGYAREELVEREELIARRIIRLDPEKLAR